MSDKRLNLAVIMGGKSSEHEVSLNSGISMLNALDKSKYNIKIIKIDKQGQWLISPYIKELPASADARLIEKSIVNIKPVEANLAVDKMDNEKIDVALIAMHGKYGEDGRIQALLEFAGIPYQGSGVLASALAMDKIKSSELFQFHGLDVPKYLAFTKENFETKKKQISQFLKDFSPAVLKPSDDGSSAGTFILKTPGEFDSKVSDSFAISDNLMIQEYIKGEEVTCGVLDTDLPAQAGSKPQALPPTQIIANSGEFYDYTSKYADGGSTHIVPAPFPEKTIKEIQGIALRAHQILGCRGLSRTDMILRDGKIYILETNTLPGFTSTSLFPEEAQAAGISFTELIDKLVQSALNKK